MINYSSYILKATHRYAASRWGAAHLPPRLVHTGGSGRRGSAGPHRPPGSSRGRRAGPSSGSAAGPWSGSAPWWENTSSSRTGETGTAWRGPSAGWGARGAGSGCTSAAAVLSLFPWIRTWWTGTGRSWSVAGSSRCATITPPQFTLYKMFHFGTKDWWWELKNPTTRDGADWSLMSLRRSL